ncbi:MAG: nucleotidyltransferase domain-containing protein [Anaerolineae bacterium]|nr:nucleotidyltransferase domain-containing protein [Anaerolineae bacterium]
MATESAVLPAKDDVAVDEDYAAYLPHIRRRWLAEQAAWARRREEAWVAAREVAAILRSRFGAREVIAFGSLARQGPFTERSDVDLAVSGIAPSEFFRAWAAAAAACSLELDLVDLADCSPGLRRLIEEEGVPL